MTDLERCHTAALRILSYRWNSEAELRRKLRAKRFEEEIVDDTIAKLREEKWLDDGRYAESFVRSESLKRHGRTRIRRALHAAGVDRETAETAVRANLDPEQEIEGLRAACAKRMRLLARRHGDEYLETAEGRNNLTAWLLKEGYDAALIHSIVKEIRVVHDE